MDWKIMGCVDVHTSLNRWVIWKQIRKKIVIRLNIQSSYDWTRAYHAVQSQTGTSIRWINCYVEGIIVSQMVHLLDFHLADFFQIVNSQMCHFQFINLRVNNFMMIAIWTGSTFSNKWINKARKWKHIEK